ncbi:gluconokinase [Amphibacillus indicireducens]|uniref:Gluconokinase n=1 Tax=Amphibacillus indicireducens TaxID=1076330 RepID=A0ABP7VHT2_9BACI
MRELVIGLDMGTTSVKVVIFDLKGKLITQTEELITTSYPKSDWAEQNPNEIEKACILAMKNAISELNKSQDKVLAVGISAAMHSLICIDEEMDPLSPVMIWSDKRSSQIAEKLIATNDEEIYSKTGTPIHPMTPFLKLIWLREENLKAYQNASYFMSMKEYLVQKWFGKRMIDYSMASATGLFNAKELKWERSALKLAGIKEEQLSEVVPPTEILIGLTESVAQEIGLSPDTPFVIGAADGQLANLGSGAIEPGEVNISVGTSGAIRQFVKGAPINHKMETFTYAFTEDTSIIGGATNNGGIALEWFKDLIEYEGSYDDLLILANKIEIGADGLIFIPYINGERAPLWNGRAKGNFYGLSINHKKEHLIRAVLEGIALNLYHISQSLEEIAGPPKKITVNGGLSKSETWVQIMADILGKKIYLSDTHHNAAWGAAWTALVGIRKVQSFAEIKSNLPDERVIEPNMENHKAYIPVFEKYERLVETLKAFF